MKHSRITRDLIIIFIIVMVSYGLAYTFDIFDRFAAWSIEHGNPLKINELFIVLVMLAFAFAIFSWRLWQELRQSREQHQSVIDNLKEEALHYAHDELEQRVQERTAELLQANAALIQEVAEHKRVEGEVHRRNRELILLNQVIAASVVDSEPETVLEMICHELGRTFDVSRVTASLLNDEKSELVVAAEYSASDLEQSQVKSWLGEIGSKIPMGRYSFARYLLSPIGPLVANDAQNDPRLASLHDLLRQCGILSLFILPVRVDGEVVGSLSLESSKAHSFSEDIVSLGWSIADQIATVLARVRFNEERKRTEMVLRESEERFRRVISSISDHIYVSKISEDGAHTNLYLSPNIKMLTGYPVEKFMADASFWSSTVIHPDDRFLAADQLRRLKLGQSSEAEYRLIKADGDIIWIRDSGKVHLIDDFRIIYGVVNDITRRKQAEMALFEERALLAERVAERTADLSRANAELARVSRLKDEFLANMSHELRTPLNVVIGMSDVLRSNIYGPLTQEQGTAISYIEESGRHLLNLINDILDLSKIEADKLNLVITPVSVEDVCQASLRLIKQMAQTKQIKIFTSLDESVTILKADERRLKQILVNLLTNAVKFTPEKGQVGLEVTGDESKGLINFTVWDTGIGISTENMELLFQPFVQLDSKLSRQYDGTGLGLALVSRLAHLHGGSVSVESEIDRGSRFTVSLPWSASIDPAQEIGWPKYQPLASIQKSKKSLPLTPAMKPGGRSPLILVAEDNESNIVTLSDFLIARGYQVIVARNGQEALNLAEAESPALILMDIQMPLMDGLEAIRRIRCNDRPALAALPIIALTALAMPGDREKCLDAGANTYLSKPVSLVELAKQIETQITASTS